MPNEGGEWIMYGVDEDAPDCIHTADELTEYINKVGFLPLFKNEIPGFSVEEHTVATYWWSGDTERDPWEWREIIAKEGNIAYGKFFDKKAGFISREWLPYFCNYRRDGYDFDALYDDEKASRKYKKIMDIFDDGPDTAMLSPDIKVKAGFGKDGENNFDGTVTDLQMMTYLCVKEFTRRKNKKGEYYGWPVAAYTTPEAMFGHDLVTAKYTENAEESGKQIVLQLAKLYGVNDPAAVRRVLGTPAGRMPERVKTAKKPDYPMNLIKDLKLEITELSHDQQVGLAYALSVLNTKEQELIRLRYEEGLTFAAVGSRVGRSGTSCSSHIKKDLRKLSKEGIIGWIKLGYEGYIKSKDAETEEDRKAFIKAGKIEQALLMNQSPDAIEGISASQAKVLIKSGIFNVGILRNAMKKPLWFDKISGIGFTTGRKIVFAMLDAGMIDESFPAYKETDRSAYYKSHAEEMMKRYAEDQKCR